MSQHILLSSDRSSLHYDVPQLVGKIYATFSLHGVATVALDCYYSINATESNSFTE